MNTISIAQWIDLVGKVLVALAALWGIFHSSERTTRVPTLTLNKRKYLDLAIFLAMLATLSLPLVVLTALPKLTVKPNEPISIFSSEEDLKGQLFWCYSSIEVRGASSANDAENNVTMIRGYSTSEEDIVWITHELQDGYLLIKEKRIGGDHRYPLLLEWDNIENNPWCAIYVGGLEEKYRISSDDTILIGTFLENIKDIDGKIRIILEGSEITTDPSQQGYPVECPRDEYYTSIPVKSLIPRVQGSNQRKQIYLEKVRFKLLGKGKVYLTGVTIH